MIMLGTVSAITQGIFEAFARTQTMMFIGKYSLSLSGLLPNKSISKSQQWKKCVFLPVPFIGFGMVMATALYRALFSKIVGSDKTGIVKVLKWLSHV